MKLYISMLINSSCHIYMRINTVYINTAMQLAIRRSDIIR